MVQFLTKPSVVILIVANLIPTIGVMLWGWDAFVLLMLYWLETAVIAFWTVVRIAITPRSQLGGMKFDGADKPASPLALAAFFTLHAGIFMGVHFMFLWELFSGDWSRKIHGLGDFVNQLIVATGLWVPLLVLFVARGLLMMFGTAEPALRRMFRLAPARVEKRGALTRLEALLFGLYARILVMQVTIIIGAWFALLVGTAGAYILLIVVKTAIDVALQTFAEAIHAAWQKTKIQSTA